MSSFKHLGVSKATLQSISDLGFTEPSEIQKKAIPILLQGENDLIGLAQTGTGKTAAFSIPLIERIDPDLKEVQALILAPTRELGQQIAEQIKIFSKYHGQISSLPVYGGASIQTQISALKKSKQIIIATPGRLIDLLERRALKLDHLRFLILDEADEMLNMGFKEEIDRILSFTEGGKDGRETWLFSATMSKEIFRIVKQYMHDPVEVQIDKKDQVNVNIDHCFAFVSRNDKIEALSRFMDLEKEMRGLVFCRTRAESLEVSEELQRKGYKVDVLNGDLSQAQRDRVMKRFKKNDLQCLVATDVAARGIDVNDLTHVFHFNIPDDFAYYTHRSGRTARAGKKGLSILFTNGREKSKLHKLSNSLNIEFRPIEIPKADDVIRTRVEDWCKKIIETKVSGDISADTYGLVESMLKSLSREELLARLLKMELLELQTNLARDLNQSAKESSRGNGQSRGRGKDKSRGRGKGKYQKHSNKGSGYKSKHKGGGKRKAQFKSKGRQRD